jgi:DNA repair exonuclease SbcCD ATPase subunit
LSEKLKDLDEQIKDLLQCQEALQRPAADTLGECVDTASALEKVSADVEKAQELRRQAALDKHAEDLDEELSQLSQIFGFRSSDGISYVKLTKKIDSLRLQTPRHRAGCLKPANGLNEPIFFVSFTYDFPSEPLKPKSPA